MPEIIDSCGRKIDYFRISVTDRCNLRCVYCMPAGGISSSPRAEMLSFEEIERVVRVAAADGITRVRITGGEPLVRKHVEVLVKQLARIRAIQDIAMTTNGTLLKQHAGSLKAAGLNRINISLDTLDPVRYRKITRMGSLDDVFDGMHAAVKAGFPPIKLNTLMLEGLGRREIRSFLLLSLEHGVHVRFLEYMPVGNETFSFRNRAADARGTIMEEASAIGTYDEAQVYGNGTSVDYRFKGGKGTFGLVSPMTGKFCAKCNRLRLTSAGLIKICLHSNITFDLKARLRGGASDGEISALIREAVARKPASHELDRQPINRSDFLMCQVGG
ncbi:MAG: cyclic pyranopterin phosphate synthase MoaA [Planctomycetes bacterium RBG_16_64_10]|nr:MAG: cyclic pyranopterin phosphate synthase MoaA [Planctomycetes bacterium RBG_16_64_10]